MNAKNIFRNIRGLAMSALLLIPAAFRCFQGYGL